MRNFSNLVKEARQEYIIEVINKKNPVPLFQLIPITKQEAAAQKNESNMTRIEILCKIESLLEQMSEAVRKNIVE